MEDAKKCEEAGAFMIVLECVPKQLAEEISKSAYRFLLLELVQVLERMDKSLVYHDVSGYGVDRIAKFVKQYCSIDEMAIDGLKQYVNEVKSRSFQMIIIALHEREEITISLWR